jgi:hypothetical protein
LGKVAEEEDTSEGGKTESDGWDEFVRERLPELAFREEVEDALEHISLAISQVLIRMDDNTLMG